MNTNWWKKSVVYQIYPRSFQDSNGDGIGDLNGITARLEYLAKLGIDVIWLSPVYQSPNDDNGYDISDYQAIMPEFGTMEDFDRMLAKAHSLGIRIVMDLVVNHTSDEHPWFLEARKSKDNPYRDYYIWKDKKEGGVPNNWGSCFGGTAWEWDEQTEQYYLHLFSRKQPDLNWENPKVRDEVYSMMDWWLKKGIDGFRMDVISCISKDQTFADGIPLASGMTNHNVAANGPRVHEFLQEMNRRVLSNYDIMTVGECAGCTVEEAKKYANLDGSELSMAFEFEHTSVDDHPTLGHYALGKLDFLKLKEIMTKWQTRLEGTAWNSLYWNNHDQVRIVSRWGNDSETYRKISAKMLATCLHLMKGTPYIYEGEEIGMTNMPYYDNIDQYDDIESKGNYFMAIEKGLMTEAEGLEMMHRRSRDHARTPMQWDASEQAGFTTGTPWLHVNPNYTRINAQEAMEDPDSIFYYYQALIRLRKEHEVIVEGRYELLEAEHPQLFVYTRTLGEEKLLVVCNFSDQEVPYEIPQEFADASILIRNTEELQNGQMIPPYGAFVLEKNREEKALSNDRDRKSEERTWKSDIRLISLPEIAVLGKEGLCTEEKNLSQELWKEANSHFDEVADLGMREKDGSLVGLWGAMSDETMSFQPWTNGFTRGYYLAGIEVYQDTPVPEGWKKWILPARTYLVVDVQPDIYMQVFHEVLNQVIPERRLKLCGAVCDHTKPSTGQSMLFFPVIDA